MKIVTISDTHGYLPDIPACDIFIHAGDICPATNHKVKYQKQWLIEEFNPWLKNINAKSKVITAGNHDFVFQEYPNIKYNLDCIVLINEIAEIQGLKIWGSPWTKKFYDWAFNMSAKDLYKLHINIPKCDIIVTHGPPYGFGDLCSRSLKDENGNVTYKWKSHQGSPGLTRRIIEMEPKLVVGGHIHSGFGTRKLGNTIICNTSFVNEGYRPAYLPHVFEI